MSSILKVDQIQLSNGNTPTAGDLGLNDTGTVLQMGLTTHSTVSQSASTSVTMEITSGSRPSITKKQTGSKIIYEGAFAVYGDVDSDGHSNVNAEIKVERIINGGSATQVYLQASMMDRGGQSRMRSYIARFEDTAGSAGDVIEYRAYARCTASSSSRLLNVNNTNVSTTKLTEIAG